MSKSNVMLAVFAAGGIAFIGFGTRSSFGLFLAPMSADLGWGREVYSMAMAVQNLIWGASLPFAGMLADRFGVSRVLALGGLVYCGGILLMAVPTSPAMFILTGGVIAGAGLAFGSFTLAMAAVGKIVPAKRLTTALGIIAATGSFGQFVITPIGQGFLNAYGWQVTLPIIAVLAALIIPLAIGLRGGPAQAPASPGGLRTALGEARRHTGYKLLTLGFFVCGFHVAFIVTHLPAYLQDIGISGGVSSWAIAVIGLANIVGSLASGFLGDRFRKAWLLTLIYIARAVLISAFVLLPPSTLSVMTFAFIMGLLWFSTVPLTSAIVAQVFGPQYSATLFGIVFFGHQAGAFFGIWLGGYVFDLLGSYDVVWGFAVVLSLVATVLHWPIDERPLARLAAAPEATGEMRGG